jgi:hypothetical protein
MLEGNNLSSMRLKEPCFDPPTQTAISPCWASQTHEARQSAVLLLLPALMSGRLVIHLSKMEPSNRHLQQENKCYTRIK